MIKEKHEKNSDNVKEEPGSSDKETTSVDVRIKKEDEPNRPVTKNGGIVGSTNTGYLQNTNERKSESDDISSSNVESANLTLKTEECIDSDLPSDAFSLGIPGGPPHSAPPDGVQPLASNVINKQPGSMEVQYMQQQSQIFVFSTVLANTGAEEVYHGRYPSIIAYHCAQPGTKKYLEKNPLKVTQFNRQNPAQWLNNLAIMKNKSSTRSPGLGPKNPPSIDNFLDSDDMVGLGDGDLPWNQKNNHHLDGLESVSNGLPDVGPDMDPCSPSLSNVQPSLQGVKVPDENLTPQQRQHRELQLATIRKMQQMLFPENQSLDPQSGGVPGNGGNGMDMPPHNMLGGGQSGGPPNAPPPGQTMSAQLEWLKLQHQFSEDRKIKGDNRTSSGPSPCQGGGLGPSPTQQQQQQQQPTQGPGGVPIGPVSSGGVPGGPSCSIGPNSSGARGVPVSGPRLQGPPPPYHQTPRSASVPIALQSPSPSSPNNPTSNLSLPSPRASSALNSPADPNRQFGLSRHVSTGQSPTSQDSPSAPRLNHSNPGTPVSSHLSPSVTNNNTEPTTSTHQSSVDGMFGRQLQSMAQQKQIITSTTSCSTTPTAGCKEPNLMPVPSPQQIQYLNTFEGQELIIQKQPNTSLKERNISPPNLPTTLDSGFTSGNTPDLPHARISAPNTPTSIDVGPRFPSTPGGVPPARGDNVPLNPNCTSSMPGNPKVSHFDPISSLAQMSQQLTNSVASSLNGQGVGNQGPPGMMNFGSPSMHMMDMGGCHNMGDLDQGPGGMMSMSMQGPPHGFHPNSPMGGPIRSLSPKLPGAFPNHMPMPRMMGRPPGPNPYNGANVQVKPNAPNTIQYIPTKSQLGNNPGPPRGPPSLDFLQRFASPLSNMDSKMPTQNLQYFPNCGPNNGPMQGGPMPPHMSHMDGSMPPDGSMASMMGGPLGNGGGPMMGNNMGIPSGMLPMMRGGPMRPPGMMRIPQMGFNGPNESMYNHGGNNMGNPNAQMFVSGPKGSPMGMGAPDASQPLPPSMGQNNSFKNSPFVGPTTADPNYAQQFHNFQQQLYATSTRSQMGGQTMGPGPGPPHSQQPAYFNPK